jgi:hypothetical protein
MRNELLLALEVRALPVVVIALKSLTNGLGHEDLLLLDVPANE